MKNNSEKSKSFFLTGAVLAVTLVLLGGCAVEEPVAYAPGPAYGPAYGPPVYYSPYPYYAPAPPVISFGFGGGGYGYHHWR